MNNSANLEAVSANEAMSIDGGLGPLLAWVGRRLVMAGINAAITYDAVGGGGGLVSAEPAPDPHPLGLPEPCTE